MVPHDIAFVVIVAVTLPFFSPTGSCKPRPGLFKLSGFGVLFEQCLAPCSFSKVFCSSFLLRFSSSMINFKVSSETLSS